MLCLSKSNVILSCTESVVNDFLKNLKNQCTEYQMATTVLIVLLILALLEIVLLNGAAAVRIHPPDEFSLVAKQKPQRTFIR